MGWVEAKYVAAVIAALFAAVLCWRDKGGWGWFLFLAFCLGASA